MNATRHELVASIPTPATAKPTPSAASMAPRAALAAAARDCPIPRSDRAQDAKPNETPRHNNNCSSRNARLLRARQHFINDLLQRRLVSKRPPNLSIATPQQLPCQRSGP